jgi:DNA-damage-inducible protein D
LLGYTEWQNFGSVAGKAKTACEVSGHTARNHFVDANEMVDRHFFVWAPSW